MPDSNFDRALSLVLGLEGGFSDNPSDAGGMTNYGISTAAFPDLDIVNLTMDRAKAIYQERYWAPIKGDFLPGPVALIVFDGAVNHGVHAASCTLQAALDVTMDGQIGAQTIRACQSCADVKALVLEIAARRALRYAAGDIETFGLGWYRRLMTVTSRALEGLL